MTWLTAVQIFSPIAVVLGLIYQAGRLYFLRVSQRNAIRRLCLEITMIGSHRATRAEVMQKVRKIRALFVHFDRCVFGVRTPSGLLDVFTEVAALIQSMEVDIPEMTIEDEFFAEVTEDSLKWYADEAEKIWKRATLVLFTL